MSRTNQAEMYRLGDENGQVTAARIVCLDEEDEMPEGIDSEGGSCD